MDTTQTTPTTRTIVRALGSALAVGLVGVGALPAATAQAAGVRTHGLTRVPATLSVPVADPSALPTTASTVVRYRVEGGRARAIQRS